MKEVFFFSNMTSIFGENHCKNFSCGNTVYFRIIIYVSMEQLMISDIVSTLLIITIHVNEYNELYRCINISVSVYSL